MMSTLFEPVTIGNLTLPNRIMRSATAERRGDPETGFPRPELADMYAALARGGVGLIVTGHAYVHRRGKAHPEMTSIATDDVIPAWKRTIRPAQGIGVRMIMQINFAGASVDPKITPDPLSPSGVPTNEQVTPAVMTEEEIQEVIHAFGQAARRVREIGFDGVQIHGAHGYGVNQFLTPSTNQRDDAWGGDPERRRAFLDAIVREMRSQVGDDFPLWIKLGVAGKPESGLTIDEGAQIAAACAAAGVDSIEISHGIGNPAEIDEGEEACFRPMAEAVRRTVGDGYPLALVNGFSSLPGMESVLADDLVQLISICRPLIAEPDFPNKLRADNDYQAVCRRCWRCWPKEEGKGVACRNSGTQKRLAALSESVS